MVEDKNGKIRKDQIECGIEELGEKFVEDPLDFTVEASLVAELQNIMRNKDWAEKINVCAKYKEFDDEKYEEDNPYTEYKEKYLEEICDQDRIHKVQIEVNFGNKRNNKLLDLAVLGNDKPKIVLINGTKYFHPKYIQHAVEVKFVKNKNIAPPITEEGKKDKFQIEDLPKLFKKDVKELNDLDNVKSRHLVIFSNKNIFQINEEGGKYNEKAQNRYRILKKLCDMDNGENNKIELHNYFPTPDEE